MTTEKFDLADGELDDEEFTQKLLVYLLKLDGEPEPDEKVFVKTEVSPYDKDLNKIYKITDKDKTAYNKLYFNGESDSNQSRYETMCNHMKVCTVAKTKKVGLALHTLLRHIFNGGSSMDMIDYIFNLWCDKPGELTMKQIVEEMYEASSTYASTFDPKKEKMYTTCYLSGLEKNGKKFVCAKTKLERLITEIDMWNIHRVGNALGIWTPIENYGKGK